MNRRNFLTALLGSALAAPLLARLEAADAVQVIAPDLTPVAWDATCQGLLYEAFRLLRAETDRLGWPIRQEAVYPGLSRIGEVTPTGQTLVHQLAVTCSREGVAIRPAMSMLAEQIAFDGIDEYGELPITLPGAQYVGRLDPLRMMITYNVVEDCELVRFDVLGGQSIIGMCRQELQQREALKRRIRGRLRHKRVFPIPV